MYQFLRIRRVKENEISYKVLEIPQAEDMYFDMSSNFQQEVVSLSGNKFNCIQVDCNEF